LEVIVAAFKTFAGVISSSHNGRESHLSNTAYRKILWRMFRGVWLATPAPSATYKRRLWRCDVLFSYAVPCRHDSAINLHRCCALSRWFACQRMYVGFTALRIYMQSAVYPSSVFVCLSVLHRHELCQSNSTYHQTVLASSYRATRMYRATMPWQDVCLSVRLSVRLSHAGILSKRLHISSNFFNNRVAPPFYM